MGLFSPGPLFSAKKSAPTPASSRGSSFASGDHSIEHKPNLHGHVTKRELEKEVVADLRKSGVSLRDREIIEATASGYLDANGFRSTGINAREKEHLMDTLEDKRQELGLTHTDVKKVDDALNKALEN